MAYDDSIPAYDYYSDEVVLTDADWQGTRYVSMPAKNISFICPQDVVDRLNAMRSEEDEGRMIFDFSGRRVSAMKSKGLYIVNGKKILKQ